MAPRTKRTPEGSVSDETSSPTNEAKDKPTRVMPSRKAKRGRLSGDEPSSLTNNDTATSRKPRSTRTAKKRSPGTATTSPKVKGKAKAKPKSTRSGPSSGSESTGPSKPAKRARSSSPQHEAPSGPYTLDPNRSSVDPSSFPHIVDVIVEDCGNRGLLRLRAASRAFAHRVHSLATDVVITSTGGQVHTDPIPGRIRRRVYHKPTMVVKNGEGKPIPGVGNVKKPFTPVGRSPGALALAHTVHLKMYGNILLSPLEPLCPAFTGLESVHFGSPISFFDERGIEKHVALLPIRAGVHVVKTSLYSPQHDPSRYSYEGDNRDMFKFPVVDTPKLVINVEYRLDAPDQTLKVRWTDSERLEEVVVIFTPTEAVTHTHISPEHVVDSLPCSPEPPARVPLAKDNVPLAFLSLVTREPTNRVKYTFVDPFQMFFVGLGDEDDPITPEDLASRIETAIERSHNVKIDFPSDSISVLTPEEYKTKVGEKQFELETAY